MIQILVWCGATWLVLSSICSLLLVRLFTARQEAAEVSGVRPTIPFAPTLIPAARTRRALLTADAV